jgi:hypothetical protein
MSKRENKTKLLLGNIHYCDSVISYFILQIILICIITIISISL